ncbi:MAG TPA: hypothetical protein ENN21_09725 [Spirochaetes bacterium]|nr:hypothetical protein [Spirochaetota bacterium]
MKKLLPVLLWGLTACAFYQLKDDPSAAVFENRFVRVEKALRMFHVNVVITNKTTSPMEILWDRSAYIDLDGKRHAVNHRMHTYGPDGRPVNPPTVIPPGGSVRDLMMPADTIKYDGMDAHRRKFQVFGTSKHTHRQAYSMKKEYHGRKELAALAGREYAVVLTVSIDGKILSWTIPGRVTGVEEVR